GHQKLRLREGGDDARQPVDVVRGLLDHVTLPLSFRNGQCECPEHGGRVNRWLHSSDRILDQQSVVMSPRAREDVTVVLGRGSPVACPLDLEYLRQLLLAVEPIWAWRDVTVSPEARLSDDRDVGMRAEYASEPRRSAASNADDEVDLAPRTVRLRDATSHAGSAVQRSAARAPDLNASSIDR